jgi:hypothetical protein
VLTGSGLGQQNASTRRCCNPIRSDDLERVTRIELALPAWKTKSVRLWLGSFLICKGKG